MRKANYKKVIDNNGSIIELIGSYEDNGQIMNVPEMLNEEETKVITDIMRKNGIKKMDIIL